jgi:hypothetical protein
MKNDPRPNLPEQLQLARVFLESDLPDVARMGELTLRLAEMSQRRIEDTISVLNRVVVEAPTHDLRLQAAELVWEHRALLPPEHDLALTAMYVTLDTEVEDSWHLDDAENLGLSLLQMVELDCTVLRVTQLDTEMGPEWTVDFTTTIGVLLRNNWWNRQTLAVRYDTATADRLLKDAAQPLVEVET